MFSSGETEYSTHEVSFSMISHHCMCVYDYLNKKVNSNKEYVDFSTKIMFWHSSNKSPASSKTERCLCPTLLESESRPVAFLLPPPPPCWILLAKVKFSFFPKANENKTIKVPSHLTSPHSYCFLNLNGRRK